MAIAIGTSGDHAPACDWLALMDEVDMDDPLTVECSNIGSQLTVIFGFGSFMGFVAPQEGTRDEGETPYFDSAQLMTLAVDRES